MKLSDYVAQFIRDLGVRRVFVMSGGAAVHLIDSIARTEGVDYVCIQHEEAAAMAADAYARVGGSMGVGITTSGPGGTNLLTGVCCSYFDSVPVLFITGQVATFRLKKSTALRQVGFQETDMPAIFKPITKYSARVERAEDIRYHLEKAVYLAREGRPGPVLIDLPDDLQRVDIDPNKLRSFIPVEEGYGRESTEDYVDDIQKLLKLIEHAQRPVLVIGAGVRVAGVEDLARELVERLRVPFLLTWGGMDIWPYDHPLNVGGFGACGPRGGNFVAQNADLVVALGTRLSQMITGGVPEHFARGAKKVMIDIDREEIAKFADKGMSIDLGIRADLRSFLPQINRALVGYVPLARMEWEEYLRRQKSQWGRCGDGGDDPSRVIDANYFIEALSREAAEGDVVITDAGGNLTWTMQSFHVKKGQRLFSAWNHSPMGYSLAAACGASIAAPHRRVISIIGDGGLQMCVEELATVARYQIPIKIFLFNNQGHGIQKQTIETWLEGRYEGVNEKTGLYFPDFKKLAEAYGLRYMSISSHVGMGKQISDVLNVDGPVFCDVAISPDQRIKPMLTYGRPLEDQGPLLSRKDFLEAMIIEPLPESMQEAEMREADSKTRVSMLT